MNMLLADGFEDAFIGVAVCNGNRCAVYDQAKCIEILMERDGMTHEDAVEYFDYNVLGSLSDEVDATMPACFTSMTLKERLESLSEEE